ncbi:MAG: peptide chain release factor 1 [Candidatus Omnitrophica bacterium 4484_70.2]|nr:MAG: peptide chain release factor 1 [Candidatus Omnitrophica bacterium 4484_70.2]
MGKSRLDFQQIKKEYQELSFKLASTVKDREEYKKLVKRFSFLEKIYNLVKEYEKLDKERQDLEKIVASNEEEEIKEIARQELSSLREKIQQVERKIEEELFSEEDQDKDIIMEIRSAAGGEESALFAADLFRMYSRFIEKKRWRLEVLDSHSTELGGFKEIIFSVKGRGCFSYLKFEKGVHRVQRVPVTESGGRIHTSTVTVAVLVEPEEIELSINPEDLKIETFRASGHGGQHVNRTDSAVRITHLPTGIVATCQDERSQIKNREKAMRVLRARLLEKMKKEKQKEISWQRKTQIGSGERSEKIRTYNFPERRVTDHRINLTLYRLDEIMEGNLDMILEELRKKEKEKIYENKGLG